MYSQTGNDQHEQTPKNRERERKRETQITEKTLPSENKSEALVFHTR